MQEPGATEADFARAGTEAVIKIFLTLHDPGPLMVPKGGFADWPDKNLILPSWLSEDDICHYVDNFNKSGFTGGLNYYRNFDPYVISNATYCLIFNFSVEALYLFTS